MVAVMHQGRQTVFGSGPSHPRAQDAQVGEFRLEQFPVVVLSLEVDEAAIQCAEVFDGKPVLVTNVEDL